MGSQSEKKTVGPLGAQPKALPDSGAETGLQNEKYPPEKE
jgi:hypothetical protein